MSYPDKPNNLYDLKDSGFAKGDINKAPMDDDLFTQGYKNADESEIESVPNAHDHNWLFDILYTNMYYTRNTAEENKRLLEEKIATVSDIGQVKIGYGLNISSDGTLSVAKSLAENANVISYDLPVGSYMFWSGKNVPEYFIEPDGSELSKTQYSLLWQFVQENELIGKLYENVNDSTFKIKDLRGNYIRIADENTKLGTHLDDGLPNIKGRFSGHNVYTGVFKKIGDGQWHGNRNNNGQKHTVEFDASRMNYDGKTIYGKYNGDDLYKNKVLPASWNLKLIVKALPTPPTNSVPTGTILNYTGQKLPDGYILANGANLRKDEFLNLYNLAKQNAVIKQHSDIPKTPHAYYGDVYTDNEGIEYFTIPDLRDVYPRYIQTIDNLGTYSVNNLVSTQGTVPIKNVLITPILKY